jgi:hypothetical protein
MYKTHLTRKLRAGLWLLQAGVMAENAQEPMNRE